MIQEETTREHLKEIGHNCTPRGESQVLTCQNCKWEFFTWNYETNVYINNIGYELKIPTCKEVIMNKALE